MGLFNTRINDPYGTQGGKSVQRKAKGKPSKAVKDAGRAEKAINNEQHRAYRAAGNGAARKLRGDGGPMVHDQINEAVIDAEKHVAWWKK